METVRIPHDDTLRAGTWFLCDGQPVHRCPKCKEASAMESHSVQTDGTVHASIACFPPCDYHVMGVLDDWKYGLKPAGQQIAGEALRRPEALSTQGGE